MIRLRRGPVSMLLTALLIAMTAVSAPAMVMESLPGHAMHHHGATHHAAHDRTASECCDLCWVACSAPPGTPATVTLDTPVEHSITVPHPVAPVLATILVPHRLPYPLGPPSLQA